MKQLLRLLLPLALAALACNLPVGSPTVTPSPAVPTPEPATATVAAPPTTAPPTDTPAAPTAAPVVTQTTPPEPEVNLLAYVTGGQLLVTNVAGGVLGGTTQYTQAGVDDQVFAPVWSPSGEYIAYTSRAGSDPHIFYVYAEGAGTPFDLGPGSSPAWSPDSATLVYQRDGNLWLTPIDPPAPTQITFQDNWAWGGPIFTPDGSAVLVAGNSFDLLGASGNTQFTLDRVPLDGSGTQTPLPGMTQPVEGRLPYDVRYSPDGSSIAFATTIHFSACSAPGDHYVLNADGSNLRRVFSPSLEPFVDLAHDIALQGPSFGWAPAGDALAITGGVWDCSPFLTGGEPAFVAGPQMSVVGLDGVERVIIPGFFYNPAFDRTGAMLAAELASNTEASRVQVFSPEGTLLLDLGEGGQPVFHP